MARSRSSLDISWARSISDSARTPRAPGFITRIISSMALPGSGMWTRRRDAWSVSNSLSSKGSPAATSPCLNSASGSASRALGSCASRRSTPTSCAEEPSPRASRSFFRSPPVEQPTSRHRGRFRPPASRPATLRARRAAMRSRKGRVGSSTALVWSTLTPLLASRTCAVPSLAAFWYAAVKPPPSCPPSPDMSSGRCRGGALQAAWTKSP
mmetsp:Transcript_58510/g.183670  ORF Transcript_58510/g.183670 Transcript_58510/m.183670 type:complete len:211 (-) Transcript_58510:7-639(-)